MIVNELNITLIEAVKDKLPTKSNLANTLMDILYLGREAVYRRLRGEVPFTLAEAAIISRKIGVSLDNIVGVSFSNNAVFDMNVVHHDNPFDTYYSIIDKYVKMSQILKEDSTSEMGTASNVIPQTLSFNHDILSKFRLFKWMYQNDNIKCKHFDELELPQKLLDKQKEFADMRQHIRHNDHIWDSMIFQHTVNDIQYFSDIHLISEEDKKCIKEDLLLLIDELEDLAGKGKSETGNDIRIYISSINFEATYSYIEASALQVSMIRVYAINSITTQDTAMFNSLKEWIQSLKKFSTLISESGEMQRILFFKQQREIIQTL